MNNVDDILYAPIDIDAKRVAVSETGNPEIGNTLRKIDQHLSIIEQKMAALKALDEQADMISIDYGPIADLKRQVQAGEQARSQKAAEVAERSLMQKMADEDKSALKPARSLKLLRLKDLISDIAAYIPDFDDLEVTEKDADDQDFVASLIIARSNIELIEDLAAHYAFSNGETFKGVDEPYSRNAYRNAIEMKYTMDMVFASDIEKRGFDDVVEDIIASFGSNDEDDAKACDDTPTRRTWYIDVETTKGEI